MVASLALVACGGSDGDDSGAAATTSSAPGSSALTTASTTVPESTTTAAPTTAAPTTAAPTVSTVPPVTAAAPPPGTIVADTGSGPLSAADVVSADEMLGVPATPTDLFERYVMPPAQVFVANGRLIELEVGSSDVVGTNFVTGAARYLVAGTDVDAARDAVAAIVSATGSFTSSTSEGNEYVPAVTTLETEDGAQPDYEISADTLSPSTLSVRIEVIYRFDGLPILPLPNEVAAEPRVAVPGRAGEANATLSSWNVALGLNEPLGNGSYVVNFSFDTPDGTDEVALINALCQASGYSPPEIDERYGGECRSPDVLADAFPGGTWSSSTTDLGGGMLVVSARLGVYLRIGLE